MLGLNEEYRFYVYTGKVNLRRGCMSLCEVVRSEMKANPADERNVYIFINRRCNIIKLLHYERGCYVLYEKRPVAGRFRKPVYDAQSGRYKICYADAVCLTEGLARTEIRLPKAGE